MRIRHMLTLALAAMVAVMFAVPALASANWTENGKEITGVQWSKDGAPLSGEAGSAKLSGPVKWNSANGGIECAVDADVTFNANSNSGQLTKFTASNCKVLGPLSYLCNKVTAVTAQVMPWGVSAIESGGARKVSITGIAISYTCDNGGTQVETSVIGSITGTPDNSASIGSLTVSGTGNAFYGPGKAALGTVAFSGPSPLSVTPAGKYGIVKTTRNVAVSGTLGWNSANGGMSCTVNGNLALEAGGEGKLTSLKWSDCSLSGGMAAGCGANGVKSVTSNLLPSAIIDQGSSIKFTNFSLVVDYLSCSDSTFSGEMLATPDNASAISSTSLAGTLEQGGINRSWSGSLNWTPAGVYGL